MTSPGRRRPFAAVDPTMAIFGRLPPNVVQALMGVGRADIKAAFAAIHVNGGMNSKFRDELGLARPNWLSCAPAT